MFIILMLKFKERIKTQRNFRIYAYFFHFVEIHYHQCELYFVIFCFIIIEVKSASDDNEKSSFLYSILYSICMCIK